MVLVGDGNRGIMQLLRIALCRGDHGERKRVDDEPDEHIVVQKAPQFLGAEPEDVGDAAHRSRYHQRSCLRSSRLSRISTGTKIASMAMSPLRSWKPRPLMNVPALIGTK